MQKFFQMLPYQGVKKKKSPNFFAPLQMYFWAALVSFWLSSYLTEDEKELVYSYIQISLTAENAGPSILPCKIAAHPWVKGVSIPAQVTGLLC